MRRQTPPVYPPRAIALRQEGTVLLDVHVRANGRPDQLLMLRSSGYPLLDMAAFDSVKNWLFDAPSEEVLPAAAWVQVPVRFELR